MNYKFATDEYSGCDEIQLIVGDEIFGERSISVGFKDRDGKVVSLAFDGGRGREINWEYGKAYRVYSDCPIYDGDGNGCRNVEVVRFLRDALNKLNLGD